MTGLRAYDPGMTASPPAGWYPHPTMAGTQQYWDGQAWTDHVAPGNPAAPTPTVQAGVDKNTGTLVTWGLLTAIFLPLVGFIIGVVLLPRSAREGIIVMLVAVAAAAFWVSQFA